MVKKILVFKMLFVSVLLFGNDFYIRNTGGQEVIEYNYNEHKYEYETGHIGDKKLVFYNSDIVYEKDGFGYLYLTIDDTKSVKKIGKQLLDYNLDLTIHNIQTRNIVITGGKMFLFYSPNIRGLSFMVSPEYKFYSEHFTYVNRYNEEAHSSPYFDEYYYTHGEWDIIIYNLGIKKVISSSFLQENLDGKTVEYSTFSLNKRYVLDFVTLYWNSELPPWVEGVKGYGIGEWLEVTYEKPIDNIVILNGYVDFLKTHLYKANSRVKKFKVISEDNGEPFEIEIELEDIVKFQYFKLPRKTEKIKLEIADVYKGTKWADTAITGLFTLGSDDDEIWTY